MRREYRERFPRHRRLTIPTCITSRVLRTCRDACRDRKLAVSLKVRGRENVPGIPCACATRNFTYLARGPWIAGVAHVVTAVDLYVLYPATWVEPDYKECTTTTLKLVKMIGVHEI